MIDDYLARWGLVLDGEPILTHSSILQPVLFEGAPAMLKIARSEEEQRGNDLMMWWAGRGSAKVLARGADALLMERARGHRSLAVMARSGGDGEATRIICEVTGALHSVVGPAPCHLVNLRDWFRDLAPAAQRHGGMLVSAAAAAQDMLASQEALVPLHGDIHHGNILDFGPDGWRAIDPKGLLGDPAFDYVNILRNPDRATATTPGRLEAQIQIICRETGLERQRLLKWTLAFSGLSAAWSLNDGDEPNLDHSVAEIVTALLQTEACRP